MSSFNLVNPITSSIRQIFMVLDFFVYYFLQFNFELFFHIVTFNVVDREMIYNIVSRVQLVVGIFMMFQLVMIIIKGIVNPDSVTDSKSGGAGNIVMRIIVSLAMLALIVPINIPSPKNEYEKQINNNGILFGTLYSLQYRILSNNTIGKLILGSDASNYTSKEPDETDMHDFANRFTTTILRTFYPLNVDEDGNYICQDGWDEEYYNDDREPLWIISQGARKCGSSSALETAWDTTIYGEVGAMVTGKKYAVSMSYLTCTLVGLVIMALVFIMVFSVAKRVFQLAALQLLAPIPIISYMDPKGSKDGAFNSWLKLLGKTYLDLFIRIASMYFAIGVIQAFMDKYFGSVEAIATTIGTTASEAYQAWYSFANWWPLIFWEFIVIVIGLLLFAIEAPKFIKQMLGVKDDGKGFFSDFGLAMGLGVTAAGAIGSFASSRRANYDADEVNAKLAKRNSLYNAYRRLGDSDEVAAAKADNWLNTRGQAWAEQHAHTRANRAKNIAAGFIGAGRGIVQGSAAASESKGNAWAKMMAARDAMHKGDEKARAAGRNGSTALSGLLSLGREAFTGQNEYDSLDTILKKQEQVIKNQQLEIKKEDDINDHYSKISARVNSKALTSDKVRCELTNTVFNQKLADLNYTLNANEDFLGGSYIHWDSVSSAAVSSGADTFDYEWKDAAGNVHTRTIKTKDVKQINEIMKDLATDSYLSQALNDATFDGEITENVDSLMDAGVNPDEVKGIYDNTTGKYTMRFNGGGGFKDIAGRKSRATARRKDELNKQSEAINRKRQGDEGQKAKSDSEFGRKS